MERIRVEQHGVCIFRANWACYSVCYIYFVYPLLWQPSTIPSMLNIINIWWFSSTECVQRHGSPSRYHLIVSNWRIRSVFICFVNKYLCLEQSDFENSRSVNKNAWKFRVIGSDVILLCVNPVKWRPQWLFVEHSGIHFDYSKTRTVTKAIQNVKTHHFSTVDFKYFHICTRSTDLC